MNQNKTALYEILLLIKFNVYNDLLNPEQINEKIEYLIKMNWQLFNTGVTTSNTANRKDILKGLVNHTINQYTKTFL